MTPDETIVEFVRERGAVRPPPDLVDGVMRAVSAMPRSEKPRFASLFAVAGAAAVVVLLAVIGLYAAQQRDVGGPVGPPSSASATRAVAPTLRSSAAPTAAPTGTPIPTDGSLTELGSEVTLDAVDETGVWGTITLERGHNSGGYHAGVPDPQAPSEVRYFQNDPSAFYVEVLVHYDAERLPAAEFGSADWELRSAETGAVAPLEQQDPPPLRPVGVRHGTTDVLSTPADGWLVFRVPREAADETLELVYLPSGESIPVRTPEDPPEPIASGEAPRESTYVTPPGGSLSVIESPEAHALFAETDTCTNPVAGYTVTYPDSWYTNTAIGDVPACSWFSPVLYEVEDPAVPPDEIVLRLSYIEDVEAIGQSGEVVYSEEVQVGGTTAQRSEQFGVGGGFIPIGSYVYEYHVFTDGTRPTVDAAASVLFAQTAWQVRHDAETYELNKAVLDRIMASIELTE